MSTNKNISNESITENISEIPSIIDDNDDHSEFDVLEAKENKAKSSDNSPDITTAVTSPDHPTTRSEASLNATLTDSGRIKRKCVIESEKRKLYVADFDSPLYMPIEEELPQKIPRIKGRRGRPPKLGPDGFPISKRFVDIKRPDIFYQSAPFDGFTYTFSTTLANLSCKFVNEGYFRNIIDHHKTINFPHNIFSQDIVNNLVVYQKPLLNNMNRLPTHMFNQPGPHMYRSNLPQMATHLPQQPHLYHNMMPNIQAAGTMHHHQQQQQQQQQQPPMRQHLNTIPMVGNYPDYNAAMYHMNANTNQRPPTPSHLQQQQQQRVFQNNNIPSNVYTTTTTTTPSSNTQYTTHHPQHMINNSTPNDLTHIANAQRLNSATPTHIRTNINPNNSNNNNTENNNNTNNTIWMPKSFRPNQSSFIINSDKPILSNLTTSNPTILHNQFNLNTTNPNDNINSNNSNSSNNINNANCVHYNDPINQVAKMENPDQILHSSSSTHTTSTASAIFTPPNKDL